MALIKYFVSAAVEQYQWSHFFSLFLNTFFRSQFTVLLINVKQIPMTLFKTILAFIACGLLVSSCSQKYDETSSSGGSPTEILPPDSSRMVIKTAELKLNVVNVTEKIKEIQQAVNSMNGHVIHYEITSNRAYKQEVAYSLDSAFVVDEIHPEGLIKIRIPTTASDTFIQAMLSMESGVDKLLFDEEDITEDLNERRELAMTVPIKNKTKRLSPTKINVFAIERKTEYLKGKYRTQYVWFDIYLQGNSYLEKKKIASNHQMHPPIFINLVSALETGWYAFATFFTGLLTAWPFLLVLILLLILFKRKWSHWLKRPVAPVK